MLVINVPSLPQQFADTWIERLLVRMEMRQTRMERTLVNLLNFAISNFTVIYIFPDTSYLFPNFCIKLNFFRFFEVACWDLESHSSDIYSCLALFYHMQVNISTEYIHLCKAEGLDAGTITL